MANYFLQKNPFVVPASDEKIIKEHFGKASSNLGEFSFARMTAPPGWSEPFQTPEFDEMTFVFAGKKQIEIEGEKIIVAAEESIFIKRGIRVRYSNPFSEPCEYVSLCIPAFTPEGANRE